MVLEDDFTFRFPRQFTQKILASVLKLSHWKMCLLACRGKIKPLSKTTCQVKHCQSTLGYMIRHSYVKKLLTFWKTYLDNGFLTTKPYNRQLFVNNHQTAIDQSWKILQKKDKDLWISTRPLLGRQRNNRDSATFNYGSSFR